MCTWLEYNPVSMQKKQKDGKLHTTMFGRFGKEKHCSMRLSIFLRLWTGRYFYPFNIAFVLPCVVKLTKYKKTYIKIYKIQSKYLFKFSGCPPLICNQRKILKPLSLHELVLSDWDPSLKISNFLYNWTNSNGMELF